MGKEAVAGRDHKPKETGENLSNEEGELPPKNDGHANNGNGIDPESEMTTNRRTCSDDSNKPRFLQSFFGFVFYGLHIQ